MSTNSITYDISGGNNCNGEVRFGLKLLISSNRIANQTYNGPNNKLAYTEWSLNFSDYIGWSSSETQDDPLIPGPVSLVTAGGSTVLTMNVDNFTP